MPVSIVQWRAEIGVFNARSNAKHLKLKYHMSICFLGSGHLYKISCLLLLLLIRAGDIELKPWPEKKEILVIIFHGFIGISTVLQLITSRN